MVASIDLTRSAVIFRVDCDTIRFIGAESAAGVHGGQWGWSAIIWEW